MGRNIQILPTADDVALALADLLESRLQAGGRAVLAGGTSALKAYEAFGKRDILWSRVQFVVSDERCVPTDSPDRNETVIKNAIGRQKISFVEFPESGTAEEWAATLEQSVAELLPFDIVVLGLGEDAHTASLFPGRDIDYDTILAPVHNSPKPPADRVTITPKALAQTSLLVFVVTGAGKIDALQRIMRGEAVPPNLIPAENILILCDESALPAEEA